MLILTNQLNVDILKLHNSGYKFKELIKDERIQDLKLNFFVLNKVSLFINRLIPHIKYNPFFYVWRRVK